MTMTHSAANDGAIAPPVDATGAREPEGDRTTAGADPGLVPGADSPSDDSPVVAGGTEGTVGVAGTPVAPSEDVDPDPELATPSPAAGAGSATSPVVIPPTPRAQRATKVKKWRGMAVDCESVVLLRAALAEACDLIEAKS